MKTKYITPETEVVTLMGTKQIMDASNPDVTVNTSGSVNANAVDTREKHQGFGQGLWDDME